MHQILAFVKAHVNVTESWGCYAQYATKSMHRNVCRETLHCAAVICITLHIIKWHCHTRNWIVVAVQLSTWEFISELRTLL